jgi:hypothetical protein
MLLIQKKKIIDAKPISFVYKIKMKNGREKEVADKEL